MRRHHRERRLRHVRRLSMLLAAVAMFGAVRLPAQDMDFDRARSKIMLRTIRDDLQKWYYDSAYGGMHLEDRVAVAAARIDSAQSPSAMFGAIAQVMLDLNDSHTWFHPPERVTQVEFGFRLLPIGGGVFVSAVRPGSDAEQRGLRPGDEVLRIGQYVPDRWNLRTLQYLYESLFPQEQLHLQVRSASGTTRDVTVPARLIKGQWLTNLTRDGSTLPLILEYENAMRRMRDRHVELGPVLVWRMTHFDDEKNIDGMMRRARRAESLVLDLRGNVGGRLATLARLAGHFVDSPTVLTVNHRRTGVDTAWARPQGGGRFPGRLVILTDGRTASAAELFARFVQLENVGRILGDSTMGAVMGSYYFPHRVGNGMRAVPYGVSVTVIDVRMRTGESLERRGVIPDEIALPTPVDIAALRDPVLAHAVAVAGGSLTAEQAMALFPHEWP